MLPDGVLGDPPVLPEGMDVDPAIAAPQWAQNFAPSGTGCPHFAQNIGMRLLVDLDIPRRRDREHVRRIVREDHERGNVEVDLSGVHAGVVLPHRRDDISWKVTIGRIAQPRIPRGYEDRVGQEPWRSSVSKHSPSTLSAVRKR